MQQVRVQDTYIHLYSGTSLLRTLWDVEIIVLITEVSSIQRSFNTLKYYTGTQNGVLVIEVSTFQRFVMERFHCIRCMHVRISVGPYALENIRLTSLQ